MQMKTTNSTNRQGRGQTFQKWLEELTRLFPKNQLQKWNFTLCWNERLANEMKALLQPYVEKPISVLETGSIIQTRTGENAWANLIPCNS